MTIRLRATAASSLVVLLMACGPEPAPEASQAENPHADLLQNATALYQHYGADIAHGRADSLSRYYHPSGALIVRDGHSRRLSRAGIDSMYGGDWTPPTYFAWDSLAFDSVAPREVLATGGFYWHVRGQPDTLRFIYAALLQRVDSAMAIRFEHETLRPSR